MKENDCYNTHRKFQVNSINIFVIISKNKFWQVATIPSISKFDSLPYPYPKIGWFFKKTAKMTAKNDPIICSDHLMAETSVLVVLKNPKGVVIDSLSLQ